MSRESNELWSAMKNAKFRNTLSELEKTAARPCGDLSAFMSGLLDVVARAVHAEIGTLWYYAKFADGRIHPKATYGGGDLGDFSLAPGEGIAGRTIEEGKGMIVEDCQKDPRWSGKADAKTGLVTKSMICVPVMDGDNCFGCIQVVNRTDGNCYDEQDYIFMEKLALEVGRIVKKHSGDLVLGCFGAFDDEAARGLNAIIEVNDRERMLQLVRDLPQYKTLSAFSAWRFRRHCLALWKLMCHRDGSL